MLMVAGVAVILGGDSTIGLIVAVPIMFVGNYLNVMPVAVTAILGLGCAIMLFHNIWLRQT